MQIPQIKDKFIFLSDIPEVTLQNNLIIKHIREFRIKVNLSVHAVYYLKVGCLHPVACTRSGSGFPSNVTLVCKFYSVTATCFGLMTIFRRNVALDGNPEPDMLFMFIDFEKSYHK
jgi:hypothetical protein